MARKDRRDRRSAPLPLIEDPREQVDHIRNAVNGRQHWVLVAMVSSPARRVLENVVFPFVFSDAAEAAIDGFRFGTLEVTDSVTLGKLRVTFLTIKKSFMDAMALERSLASQMQGFWLPPGKDIVQIGESKDETVLTSLIDAIRKGRGTTGEDATDN